MVGDSYTTLRQEGRALSLEAVVDVALRGIGRHSETLEDL